MRQIKSFQVESKENLLDKYEGGIIFLVTTIVFFITLLPVQKSISIWNQNDEFGVWQGAAWLLGLDWSEIASSHGYYGYGYGFVLFPFLKVLGNNTILMTKVAIGFQALIHASTIIIAWVCSKKIFQNISSIDRIVGATLCVITVPDLFYINMFFSECILRVLVWLIFLCIVLYSTSGRWRYNVLAILISIYAYSVHQRCILLLGITMIIFLISVIYDFAYKSKKKIAIKTIISTVIFVGFYLVEYKYFQKLYLGKMYSVSEGSHQGNLLSERNYTLKYLLGDVFLNIEAEKIAFQNLLGNYYYLFAISFGFVAIGAVFCIIYIIRNIQLKRWRESLPYLFVICSVVGGVLLVVYQYANEFVYTRVELMHYGRYSSYLYAPMILIGILGIFNSDFKLSKKVVLYTLLLFVVSGISTANVLEKNNVNNIFALPNACPGIRSGYLTSTSYMATQYHTLIGVIQALGVMIVLLILKYCHKNYQTYIKFIFAVIVAGIWIFTANKEWEATRYSHSGTVKQTYDLNKVLKNEKEFILYKANSYGGGLFQYNNPEKKIYIRNSLSEFIEEDNSLLVVSKKELLGVEEINSSYTVVYENPLYIVWIYEVL